MPVRVYRIRYASAVNAVSSYTVQQRCIYSSCAYNSIDDILQCYECTNIKPKRICTVYRNVYNTQLHEILNVFRVLTMCKALTQQDSSANQHLHTTNSSIEKAVLQ
jgi:hypothetical protein